MRKDFIDIYVDFIRGPSLITEENGPDSFKDEVDRFILRSNSDYDTTNARKAYEEEIYNDIRNNGFSNKNYEKMTYLFNNSYDIFSPIVAFMKSVLLGDSVDEDEFSWDDNRLLDDFKSTFSIQLAIAEHVKSLNRILHVCDMTENEMKTVRLNEARERISNNLNKLSDLDKSKAVINTWTEKQIDEAIDLALNKFKALPPKQIYEDEEPINLYDVLEGAKYLIPWIRKYYDFYTLKKTPDMQLQNYMKMIRNPPVTEQIRIAYKDFIARIYTELTLLKFSASGFVKALDKIDNDAKILKSLQEPMIHGYLGVMRMIQTFESYDLNGAGYPVYAFFKKNGNLYFIAMQPLIEHTNGDSKLVGFKDVKVLNLSTNTIDEGYVNCTEGERIRFANKYIDPMSLADDIILRQ